MAPGSTGASARAAAAGMLTGLLTGLASTYPWELGPGASLPVWAVVGVLLGWLLVGRGGPVPVAGATYGVFLTLAFLYSRFGGAVHDLPAYTVFVLAMSVAGGLAGVATVLLGSRLPPPIRSGIEKRRPRRRA